MDTNRSPLKAIRRKCLDCATTSRVVKYCTCDGVNSTFCALWPFRFGQRIPAAKRNHGDLMDPHKMPGAEILLEDCDGSVSDEQGQVEGL